MADYPALSTYPIEGSLKETKIDNTLRSDAEDGTVLTRSPVTALKREWEWDLRNLTDADYDLLDALEVSMNIGADVFNWTHDKTSVVYEVRFAEPIKWNNQGSNATLREAHIHIIEA